MQFRATHGNIHVHVQYSSREGGNNLFYKPFLQNIALSQIPALYGENTHSDFQNGNNGQIHALWPTRRHAVQPCEPFSIQK